MLMTAPRLILAVVEEKEAAEQAEGAAEGAAEEALLSH